MKLKSLTLANFRSYIKTKIDFDENMNVIIGQNDVGKSTILEALDIFFDGGVIKMDMSDFSKEAQDNKIIIGIEFAVDCEKEIIIDESNKTNLKDEYLLNNNGFLEVVKEFEIKQDKLQKEKVFLMAKYPKEYFKEPLINLKITDLKKKLNDKFKQDEIELINKRTSAEIRKALYEKTDDFEETKIDISKEDAKAIWEQLKRWLPLYFLFQSDRANKDSDGDIQNPLKSATKIAVSKFEDKFNEIKNELECELKNIGIDTINKMKEMGLDNTDTLTPQISNKGLDTLFSFSLESDNGIALNKRGSGFRRMVLLNYFRAEAERKLNSDENIGKNIIYALEEPETAQHPDHQKMLIGALKELSLKDNYQLILTTHTPEIAKMVGEENLIFVKKDSSVTDIENSEDKLKLIADTLGIHSFFRHKVVICVEGENDINFLLNINKNIKEFSDIIDLEKEEISIIPLQGGNLKNWVDRNYLKNSNIIEFHIYDSDLNSGKNTNKYQKEIDKINSRNDGSCAVKTNKREMENYIHKSLIEREFNIKLPEIIDYDIEDIPLYIKNKITGKDEQAIKSILNNKLSKQLTKDMLVGSEAFDEIEGWFKKIRDLINE
ncbi:ATP-binding protein [Campylobacter californiensis]|uniref:ATP-binding protein n=1 Tax=Campylobacter californiensis TaxID=1032243 RepID=UPI0014765F89|nr:ATP-binding protein [Campylobacter sp. RM12916]MBE3609042.1 ATP-binding protein [Campylobacter sp. RM12916]